MSIIPLLWNRWRMNVLFAAVALTLSLWNDATPHLEAVAHQLKDTNTMTIERSILADPVTLSKISRLELRARLVVEGVIAGRTIGEAEELV